MHTLYYDALSLRCSRPLWMNESRFITRQQHPHYCEFEVDLASRQCVSHFILLNSSSKSNIFQEVLTQTLNPTNSTNVNAHNIGSTELTSVPGGSHTGPIFNVPMQKIVIKRHVSTYLRLFTSIASVLESLLTKV